MNKYKEEIIALAVSSAIYASCVAWIVSGVVLGADDKSFICILGIILIGGATGFTHSQK